MRTLLLAGTSLLALSASAVAASAAPITFSSTGASQTFTVPSTGLYDILAIGAQGGGGNDGSRARGGLGQQVSGDFNLTAGEQLSIAVGGTGNGGFSRDGAGGGGGGGSFVVGPGNTPLVIAGGGGGGAYNAGGNALAGTAGGAGGTNGGAGGTNGSGGGDLGQGGGGLNGGGGGGSFDAGINPLFSLATAGGNGSVVITPPSTPMPAPVPEPASLALFGTGLVGLAALRRPRR